MSRRPAFRAIALPALMGVALNAFAHIATAQTVEPPVPPVAAAPQRPDQGLFQGRPPEDERRQSLFFTGSVFEAYDDNIVGTDVLGRPSGDEVKKNGFYTRVEGGLSYRKRHNRVQFTSDGMATFDYYPRLSGQIDQPIDGYNGGAGVTVQAGRGSLRLNQTLSYQPYFTLGSIGSPVNLDLPPTGADTGVAADVSLFSEPLTTYNSEAGFSTPLTRRVSMDVSYAYHGGSAAQQWTGLSDQGGAARLNFQVGRRSTLNVTYSARVTKYDPPNRPRAEITTQELQAGYSYLRQLSRTRSVGFDVGTGAALLEGNVASATGEVDRHNQALGYGGLNYQFGRSWTARGEFRRSLQVVRGLSDTFFGDSVTGSLQGLLGRRVDVRFAALYSDGNVGIGAFSSGYDTRTASLRVRYALNQNVAVSTEYMYSQYSFGRDVELPIGVVRELRRNVIRAGLTFGVPLLGRRPTP